MLQEKKEKDTLEKSDYRVIETLMPTVKVEEICYNLDNNLKGSVFPYEFNAIEFPFFSLDNKIQANTSKKYIFNSEKNSYLEISPPINSGGNKILQEFDEKLFYAIMLLAKMQNSKTVCVDYFTLAKYAGVSYTRYLSRIKEGIERLKGCNIKINNAFYMSNIKSIINEEVELNILQSKKILTFKDFLDFSEEEQLKYKKYFRNKKIKEILVLSISDIIYENIQNKGYLNFDMEKIIQINGCSRKLYILLMKWQGWQKQTHLERYCKFIASRIPLSWNKTNIPATINNLEKVCKKLVEIGYLKNFHLNRTKPLEDSIIKFEFFTTHDHDKLKNYEDKDILEENIKLSIKTGHEVLNIKAVENNYRNIEEIEDIEIVKESNIINLTDEQKNEIIKICTKGKEKITLEVAYKLISDNLSEEKDFDYLYYCLEKTTKESTRAAIAYFNKIVGSESNKMEYENNRKIKEKAEKQEQLFLFSHEKSQEIEEQKNIEVEELYENLSEIEIEEYNKKYNGLPLRVRKTMTEELYIKTCLKERVDR